MFSQIFGRFLVEQKLISSEELEEILEEQKRARVKLGLIAVSERLLSREQAEKINRKQALEDKRFGELAVELGFLTEGQVQRLLQLQANPYLAFVQAATEKGIMTLEEIEAAMELYQRENGFTNTDMENFRSGDVDRMLPLYVRTGNKIASDLIGLAIRTIIRLIDSEIAIAPSYEADSYAFENLALQNVEGQHSILLGLAGEGDSLLEIAEAFAQEEFEGMDLFAFDAICEFINCINGLNASALSYKGIWLDMLPPTYYQSGVAKAEGKLLIIPVYIKNKKIGIVIAMDTQVQVEV
ncbi:MAG: chemotaxis protein CheX [Kineothrix sp.]